MKKLVGFLVGIVVPAFIMAGSVTNSAVAQDKAAKGAPTVKVLLENDKVKVFESTYRPGDVNTGVASSATRIIRVMKGGTIERSYTDGKKETLVLKTGAVNFYTQLPAYNVKNIGKTVFQVYVVQLK
jgi:hypothetical protein